MPDLLALSLSILLTTPSLLSAYHAINLYATYSLCESSLPYGIPSLTGSFVCGISKEQRETDRDASSHSQEVL